MDRHMNVRFYSRDYDFMGMADEATVIYTGSWHTYGQFENYLDQMAPYIQQGNRIIWDRDNRKNGIIEYINVADDGSVTIKGYTLLWLLSQRITVPDAGAAYLSYNTNVEDIMYDLVQKNAVNCVDSKRNFPNLTCGTSQGRGQKLSYQTRYDGLLDCLSELSKYSMLGLSIRVDLDACKEVFEVLGGTDRSLAQDANPQVVFRRSYDNIEKEISNKYKILLTIHMDPVDTRNSEIPVLRDIISKTLQKLDKNLSFHDLRVVSGPTHTNVIFDIVIPIECQLSKVNIAKEVREACKKESEKYNVVINFDENYID